MAPSRFPAIKKTAIRFFGHDPCLDKAGCGFFSFLAAGVIRRLPLLREKG